MATIKAYSEVIDFIAAGTTPSNVVASQPSDESKRRIRQLIEREKLANISPEEKSELDHYIQLEHIMRLARARARYYLSE